MQLITLLLLALDNLRINKLRTFLTLIGIIIGVGSVVAVLLMGESGRSDIIGELESDVKQVFFLTKEDDQIENQIGREDLLLHDITFLMDEYNNQLSISGMYMDVAEAMFDRKQSSVNIEAVTASYIDLTSFIDVKDGEFFTEEDSSSFQHVAVIHQEVAEKHYGSMSRAIDETFLLNQIPFQIKGVYNNKGLMPTDNESTMYVPLEVWHRLNYNVNQPLHSMEIKVETKGAFERVREQIVEDLANYKGVSPELYKTQSMDDEVEMINSIVRIFTVVIGSIAGISLIVGGIGVMNIMLVSIMERTREIGIRKAVGAKPRQILLQFLIETIVLTTLGGILGCLAGVLVAYGITYLAEMAFVLYWPVFVIGFGITTIIGLFFGIYPAKRAASLDPIESLRYE